MKKLYLPLSLLCATPLVLHCTPNNTARAELERAQQRGRVINSPVMPTIDGKFPMSILVKFLRTVEDAINHNHSTQKNTVITLHDLAQREQSFAPEKLQLYVRKCLAALVETAQREAFFTMFDIAHPFFDIIVEDWATQFHMKNGLFYRFVKRWTRLGTEFDILASQITTLSQHEEFLAEVQQFLNDLIVSCPKAYAEYQR